MVKKVHIFKEDLLRQQDFMQAGWRRNCDHGDLIEYELSDYQASKQRACDWLSKTMLTIKSGLQGVIKWKS